MARIAEQQIDPTILRIARQSPVLEVEEEYGLAKRFKDTEDPETLTRLVSSHMRLVIRIVLGFRGYGLSLNDLVGEGTNGLVEAIKGFELEKGNRLSTYAMWQIRASIQEYILRNWSPVEISTGGDAKKLFFNLRKLKKELGIDGKSDLLPEDVRKIANTLEVDEKAVVRMNRYMSRLDYSLDEPGADLSDEENQNQETVLGNRQELVERRRLLNIALATLSDRSRDIFKRRRLQEDPDTLETLSGEHGVSRERIRQIEIKAFEKVQKAIRAEQETIRLKQQLASQEIASRRQKSEELARASRRATHAKTTNSITLSEQVSVMSLCDPDEALDLQYENSASASEPVSSTMPPLEKSKQNHLPLVEEILESPELNDGKVPNVNSPDKRTLVSEPVLLKKCGIYLFGRRLKLSQFEFQLLDEVVAHSDTLMMPPLSREDTGHLAKAVERINDHVKARFRDLQLPKKFEFIYLYVRCPEKIDVRRALDLGLAQVNLDVPPASMDNIRKRLKDHQPDNPWLIIPYGDSSRNNVPVECSRPDHANPPTELQYAVA